MPACFVIQAQFALEREHDDADPRAADLQLMKQRGTWYVPTIIAGDFVAQKAKIPGYYPAQVAAKAAQVQSRVKKLDKIERVEP